MLSQVTKVFSTCRQTKTIFLLFFLISTWTAKNGKRRFKDKNAIIIEGSTNVFWPAGKSWGCWEVIAEARGKAREANWRYKTKGRTEKGWTYFWKPRPTMWFVFQNGSIRVSREKMIFFFHKWWHFELRKEAAERIPLICQWMALMLSIFLLYGLLLMMSFACSLAHFILAYFKTEQTTIQNFPNTYVYSPVWE